MISRTVLRSMRRMARIIPRSRSSGGVAASSTGMRMLDSVPFLRACSASHRLPRMSRATPLPILSQGAVRLATTANTAGPRALPAHGRCPVGPARAGSATSRTRAPSRLAASAAHVASFPASRYTTHTSAAPPSVWRKTVRPRPVDAGRSSLRGAGLESFARELSQARLRGARQDGAEEGQQQKYEYDDFASLQRATPPLPWSQIGVRAVDASSVAAPARPSPTPPGPRLVSPRRLPP